jgi:hypothetical protein
MTNKELYARGNTYLRKAGAKGEKESWWEERRNITDAQVIAVGDLVRLCLDMKNVLMEIRAKAEFELECCESGVVAASVLADIKKRADKILNS